ncbi:MAG: hypothetical protein P8Y99_11335, partial [Calditrichaceae bacterium]
LLSQSKTDEAKDKLDKTGDKTSTTDKKSSDDDDESEESFGSEVAGFFFGLFLKGFGGIFFNIPLGEDFPTQNIYYYKYPYSSADNNSFRNADSGGSVLTQTSFSLGRSFEDPFNSYALASNLNFYGWALKIKYRFVDEFNASNTLQYFSGKLERKSRAFNNMDMGDGLGVDKIKIGNDNYTGLSLGYNLDIFFKYNFSLNFNPNVMFYNGETIPDFITSVNYHKKKYYFGLEYERLNIIGVVFNSLSFRSGLYF